MELGNEDTERSELPGGNEDTSTVALQVGVFPGLERFAKEQSDARAKKPVAAENTLKVERKWFKWLS